MSKNSFDLLADKFSSMPDKLNSLLEVRVKKRSEIIAGDARKGCPVDTSNLRDSIEGFTEKSKDTITGGAVTVNEYAAYVEFGTGPVGTQAGGHPLDGELGIVRKTEPWLGKIPINDRTLPFLGELTEKEREKGFAYRYVHGQPANPFMYTAMKQNEAEIMKEFGSAVKEVLSK